MIESLRALSDPSAKTYFEHIRALFRDERPEDDRLTRLALRIYRTKVSEFDLAFVRTVDPVKALGQKSAAQLALDCDSRAVTKIVLKAFAGKWKPSRARPSTGRAAAAVEEGGVFKIGLGLVEALQIREERVSGLCVLAVARAHGRTRLGFAIQAAVAEAMGRESGNAGYEGSPFEPMLRVLAVDAAVEWKEDEITKTRFKESIRKMFHNNMGHLMGALDTDQSMDLLDDVQELTLLWLMEALVEFCQANDLRFSTGMNNCSHTTVSKLRTRDRLWKYMIEAENVSKVLTS